MLFSLCFFSLIPLEIVNLIWVFRLAANEPVEKAILRNDLRVSKIYFGKKIELFPCSFDTDSIQIVEIGAPMLHARKVSVHPN